MNEDKDYYRGIYINWKPSCQSEYYHEGDKFVFKTKQGVPGKCLNDDKPVLWEDDGSIRFTHKERCETRSKKLLLGNYVWSADVDIDCKTFAFYSCLYQLHWSDSTVDNYVKLGVNKSGYFTINNASMKDCKFTIPCSLKIKIECRESYTNVDYFSNDQYIGSYRKLTTELPYMKFGVYAFCTKSDITQTYDNVRVNYNKL